MTLGLAIVLSHRSGDMLCRVSKENCGAQSFVGTHLDAHVWFFVFVFVFFQRSLRRLL